MSATTDQFVPLICSQCGGQIQIEKKVFETNFVSVENNAIAIYIGADQGEEKIKCQHCGTEFARKSQFQTKSGNTVIAAGDRSVAIGGSLNGGVIITGNTQLPKGKYNIVIGKADGIVIGDQDGDEHEGE